MSNTALIRIKRSRGIYLSARAILKRWGMPQRIFWEEASILIKAKMVEARRSGKSRTVRALTRDKEVLKRRLFRRCGFPGCSATIRGRYCNMHRPNNARRRKPIIGA